MRVATGGSRLFSESQGRAVIAVPPERLEKVLQKADRVGVPAVEIGEVGGDRLSVASDAGGFDLAVAELHDVWSTALPKALGL